MVASVTPGRRGAGDSTGIMDAGRRSDPELIAGIREGDTRALEELVAAYWDPLVQYADRVLGGRADPQDIVQEAFIRLWTHRERWSVDGSVRSLLYTVARNAALDERRSHARGERAALAAEPPRPAAGPGEETESAQLRAVAERAVQALPPKRQEVFRLVREEGLSYAETSEVLGISGQTVANHMSLALADLRVALAAYLDDPASAARLSPEPE